ncbi:hypothetical protein AAHN93_14415 [Vandammella animalimorsus]|uniref:hypothetical protein n=1 Tax=Vandammella animalimorsus TaxID=2029117 RepID=UPI0031BAC310
MSDVVFACEVRQFSNGDYVLIGYDLVRGPHAGYWISSRMVKVSKDAFDFVFLDAFKNIFKSTVVIGHDEADEKVLMRRWLKFCGFPSERRLDDASRVIFAIGKNDGFVDLVPARFEYGQGFAHMVERSERLLLNDEGFLDKFKSLMLISVGGGDFSDCIQNI